MTESNTPSVLLATALAVVALAGCGGDSQSTPIQTKAGTDAGKGTSLKVLQVYRPKWDEYVECAVLIGPDDTYASRSVALDCNWP